MKSLASTICLLLCLICVGCSNGKKEESKKQDKAKPEKKVEDKQTSKETAPTTSVARKATTPVQEDKWGHLTGKFVLTGDAPAMPPENINQANCRGDVIPLDDKLTVGPEGELRDVFVMMYLKGSDPPAIHPSYEEAKAEPVILDNIECRFVPHAVFLRTGQKLRMKNSDNVGHNCHGTTFNNAWNKNIPANQQIDWATDTADTSPGPVVCDLHIAWMDAQILIRDEPYAAISAEDGTFTIENIPAGDWKFQFWHELKGNLRTLQVEGYEVGRRGEIELTIADGETLDLGTMSIAGEELAE